MRLVNCFVISIVTLTIMTTLLVGCDASGPSPAAGPSQEGGIRLGAILGRDLAPDPTNPDRSAFARAENVRPFVFPVDHGSHPRFRSEWWYLVASLHDEQGNEFGGQFTLFRQALTAGVPDSRQASSTSSWAPQQAYLGHLAVTDVSAGEHWHSERLVRGHPALAQVNVPANEMSAWSARIEDWRLGGSEKSLTLTARDGQRQAMNLQLTPACQPVLQGDAGLSHKGAESASYYYSWPRLQVVGEIVTQGRKRSVQGLAWLDREFSTSVLESHLSGWNWFALHLDDGRSVMVYAMNRKDGARDAYDHGVIVTGCPEDQQRQVLASEDFVLRPVRLWNDENGRSWPVQWQLMLEGEELFVTALVDDQLMQTSITYWEGIVGVKDARGNDVGRGYMELTGY